MARAVKGAEVAHEHIHGLIGRLDGREHSLGLLGAIRQRGARQLIGKAHQAVAIQATGIRIAASILPAYAAFKKRLEDKMNSGSFDHEAHRILALRYWSGTPGNSARVMT